MIQKPRYPVYVPSKGRAHACYAARFLKRDGVPFFLVVEPQEKDVYAELDAGSLLVLPENNKGLLSTRQWIRRHATDRGADRHWQIDDNIRNVKRWNSGLRIVVSSGFAMATIEDFADLYRNVAIAGLNYQMFATGKAPPFRRNVHVYSYSLILNSVPYTWRARYNDDTDFCLQVLAGGWCTVAFNAFVADKEATMVVSGGNTDDLYKGDGRLNMARSLERKWPGVVTTGRRFKRPQHFVADAWKKFDTPLKRVDNYDERVKANKKLKLKLVEVGEVKSPQLKELLRKEG